MSEMQTIADLEAKVAKLAEDGIYLVNLFIRKDGKWQANFGSEDHSYEFGIGKTIKDAIELATIQLKYPEVKRKVENAKPKKFSKAIEDFLG